MEAIEESVVNVSPCENPKSNVLSDVNTSVAQEDLSEVQTSNGVDVTEPAKQVDSKANITKSPLSVELTQESHITECTASETADVSKPLLSNKITVGDTNNDSVDDHDVDVSKLEEITEISSLTDVDTNNDVSKPSSKENSYNVNDVQFRTEVMIKKVEVVASDTSNALVNTSNANLKYDNDATNKILSQLEGHNIDSVDGLESSGDASQCDNNNGFAKQQEVLNNEELLDILEGKDDAVDMIEENYIVNVDTLETALALRQFNELKNTNPRKRKSKKSASIGGVKDNIIKVLVKDWDDDDELDNRANNLNPKVVKTKQIESKTCELEEIDNSSKTPKDDILDGSSLDSTQSFGSQSDINKSLDDKASQRRAGRVIKKKVIFDPDNPDTFTKTKNPTKMKETETDKAQVSPKKQKVDPTCTIPKAKSPVNKTQWKKPHLKNKNQCKRLSEVDKLLMDEGAVNMIYQLTPEATKGRKNMRKKAELIKMINQNSTPEAMEMKFRDRRREVKSEENEPKKIIGHTQRTSLSSSVKSPSVCDDFEAHSADDSIIYRRHSSSSYSSTCMSPRRLSELDACAIHNTRLSTNTEQQTTPSTVEETEVKQESDVFMSGQQNLATPEIIDRKVCLNLKEKLNSKLSRALNIKRKYDSKSNKPAKQRKCLPKVNVNEEIDLSSKFEKISLNISNKLAEISIQQTGSPNNAYNIKTIKELQRALKIVHIRKDVSVVLLTSSRAPLCAGLDLELLLTSDLEKRRECAFEIADCVRSLLQSLYEHNKLLVVGIEGVCDSLAMALSLLCDIAVASNCSTFTLSCNKYTTLSPGMSVLSSCSHTIPEAIIKDMLLLGRKLSSHEAVQFGLVTRNIWSPQFLQELRHLASDIAAEPIQTVLLKKRLLKLKRNSKAEVTFLTSLEEERDLLVEHWCSNEVHEALRNS